MGYESKNSKFTNSSINDECKLLIDINHVNITIIFIFIILLISFHTLHVLFFL